MLRLSELEKMAKERTPFLEWKPIEDFDTRLETAKSNSDYLEPNCFGTAFYLLGVLPHDQVIYTSNDNALVREALDLMVEVESMESETLGITIVNNKLIHGFYVQSENPSIIYHRMGIGQRMKQEDSIDDLNYSLSRLIAGKDFQHRFFKDTGKLEPWARKVTASYERMWYG